MNKVKYNGPGVTGTVMSGKSKEGHCDGCGKEVKFLLEVTMEEDPFWFAECSCGHITIEWVGDTN